MAAFSSKLHERNKRGSRVMLCFIVLAVLFYFLQLSLLYQLNDYPITITAESPEAIFTNPQSGHQSELVPNVIAASYEKKQTSKPTPTPTPNQAQITPPPQKYIHIKPTAPPIPPQKIDPIESDFSSFAVVRETEAPFTGPTKPPLTAAKPTPTPPENDARITTPNVSSPTVVARLTQAPAVTARQTKPPFVFENYTPPLISFIIPTNMKRETLRRTLESLQKQTIPYWEAIVGVDLLTADENIQSFIDANVNETYTYVLNDPRIHVVYIKTEDDNCGDGPTRNGSGCVRNIIMQQHAHADWVAFCDDDDTLSPYYIEYWQQGYQHLSQVDSLHPDIMIFRMRYWRLDGEWFRGVLPPHSHGPVVSRISGGISFAVRRSVVSNSSSASNSRFLQFEPGQAEGFNFLLKAQEQGHDIGLTCCVGYHVRLAPPYLEDQESCYWEKAYIVEKDFQHAQTLDQSLFNETKVVPCQEKRKFVEYRTPQKEYPSDPNLPTFAFARFTHMGQGYFNQEMAFSGAIMMLADHMATQNDDYYQILLPSLVFLDYLGTNKFLQFDELFDVDHWNSFVPKLPRIVSYNQSQHHQFIMPYRTVREDLPVPDHPWFVRAASGAFQHYFHEYFLLLKSGTLNATHPTDQLILAGALRPAPAVQREIDDIVQDGNYAAIHLRVEQDYTCHPWSLTLKSRNLTSVLAKIEKFYGPNPPFSRMFFAINRPFLEDASKMPPNPKPSREFCEIERQENLNTLNRAVQKGMWNGTVKVFEHPRLASQFRHRPIIFGSVIDAEVCVQAKVFWGRFTSTFTKQIMRRRLLQKMTENYDYEAHIEKMEGEVWPRSEEERKKLLEEQAAAERKKLLEEQAAAERKKLLEEQAVAARAAIRKPYNNTSPKSATRTQYNTISHSATNASSESATRKPENTLSEIATRKPYNSSSQSATLNQYKTTSNGAIREPSDTSSKSATLQQYNIREPYDTSSESAALKPYNTSSILGRSDRSKIDSQVI